MKLGRFAECTFIPAALLSTVLAGRLFAEHPAGSLRGQVTDPSGAAVTGVSVLATPASRSAGKAKAAVVHEDGTFEIQGLEPGKYTVSAVANGFARFEQRAVTIVAGRVRKLDIHLQLERQVEQVTVSAEAQNLRLATESNASSLVIRGKDLLALSNDPDELLYQIRAISGPSAGPSGGQIYIDGFAGARLPPKQAIMEVRVNQNPFSAQYDKPGFGRTEITTKPGFRQFHGEASAEGNASAFNARNPFSTQEPPYHSEIYNGDIGGPISKKASFFFDLFRRDIQNVSVVNAFVLGSGFTPQPLGQVVLNPQFEMSVGPRIDYQASRNNLLTVRYQFWQDREDSDGISGFSLPSQGYNIRQNEHAVQISDTQVVSARTMRQLRFQYFRDTGTQMPFNTDPAVNVLGAFTSGGNFEQKAITTADHYELQSLTSIFASKHHVAFGGRLRDVNASSIDTRNFNGVFTFPTLDAYQTAEQALQQCQAAGRSGCQVSGASLFQITAGNPLASVNYLDLGVFTEDQWRVRPNFSLSFGLRYEAQNHLHDYTDFAPRVGLAWGLGRGKNPKTALRAGFGIFYDRFRVAQILQAERLNGINEDEYAVPQPAFFPTIPSPDVLAAATTALPTVYRIDPNLRAPYVMQSSIGLEREVSQNITASVTYINSHGIHQLLTNNINAPLPGTYDVYTNPSCQAPCARPFGNSLGNVFQYESVGLFNEHQLVTNFSVRVSKLSAFGYYALSYADSDTSGVGSFPMNPYNIHEDYGPAAFVARHEASAGGSLTLPRGFSLSPFLVVSSGGPFNITLGQDIFGTSVFNARPAAAAPGATGPNFVVTQFGAFDTAPSPGEPVIPPYGFLGPGQFSLNALLAKTFGWGRKTGGGGSARSGNPETARYNLEFSLSARNVFNTVNLAAPVGNLGSPLFGRSNSVADFAPYRRIDLAVRFSF